LKRKQWNVYIGIASKGGEATVGTASGSRFQDFEILSFSELSLA